MTKALAAVFALTVLVAGCSSGGAQEAGPVPTGQTSESSTSTEATTGFTTSTSTSTGASAPAPPLCSDRAAKVKVQSREGAAGTISTRWRVKNTSPEACKTFGYPGMDFHASSGWLNVQVHRGGFQNINEPPARIVLDPGESLYFVSYWSDVDTDAGPCTDFDRVKVTLPDNLRSVKLASSGCLNPESVRVGPVRGTPA